MSFSSGTFNRLYNWATDKANSIKIRADRMDAEMDGFATGLSTCILKDGTQTITANIPFSTFKLTGVGDGTAAQDAATLKQVQNGATSYAAMAGTDAYTMAMSPTVTALVAGSMFLGKVANAASGAAATLQIDSTSALSITKSGTSSISATDMPAGKLCVFGYDGTQFQLLNPAAGSEDQSILAAQIFS